MKRLVAVAVLMGCGVLASGCSSAWAGEHCIGLIAVSDGGVMSNAATGYGSAGCAVTAFNQCGCAQAFRIPVNAKLTVQSDSATIVGADYPVDAGNGIALTAGQIFPTSTAYTNTTTRIPDGGTYSGGLFWCAPAVGSASATCRVFLRSGTE